MQEPPVNLPRRSDEGMFPAASFHCDERSIHICNSNGRGHAIIVWIFAGFLISMPFLKYYIDGNWGFILEIRGKEWGGVALYLLGIFMCISAGFWWSRIRIDLVARRLEEESRWGPFYERKSASLDLFKHVLVKYAGEGGTDVFLKGSKRWCVVWARTRLESLRIAKELSARLKIPLVEN